MIQVEILIDEKVKIPKVIIVTRQVTDEINELVKKLTNVQAQAIAGFKGDLVELIETGKIIRIYSANQKVFAQTEAGEYVVRQRLYEMEEQLPAGVFVRISNSEIVNLKKVNRLDLRYSGTICMTLEGNVTTYVSRRYVSTIKQVLGI